MDLVLTGRAVAADEAERIGLVNRVVLPGTALAAAQQLARELADFPQDCLRHDRRSLLEQHGQGEDEAMARELEHGLHSLAHGAAEGARLFSRGDGRHGAF